MKISMRTVQRMAQTRTLRSKLVQGRRLVLVGPEDDLQSDHQVANLDPQLLEHLFDAFEGISALLRRCLRILVVEKQLPPFFAALPDGERRAGFAQWKEVYLRIKACQGSIEDMVRQRRCQPVILQEVYRAMVQIRTTWMEYTHAHRADDAASSEPLDANEDPYSLMTRIIKHVRRLLVGCESPANH